MRTPRLLVDDDLGGRAAGDGVPLDDDRRHHLRRVLRRGDGDAVELTDGRGHVVLATLDGGTAVLAAAPTVVAPPSPAVVVHHAVPKGRGLDDVVRVLAELGVAEVRPVLTERTESRPRGDKARSVGDRLRAVAGSACEQALSAHLCRVADPAALSVTDSYRPVGGLGVLAHPDAEQRLGAVVTPQTALGGVDVLVGPEGGFTDEEVAARVAEGWVAVCAGDTVLRSVHAAPVLVGAVHALSGRWT